MGIVVVPDQRSSEVKYLPKSHTVSKCQKRLAQRWRALEFKVLIELFVSWSHVAQVVLELYNVVKDEP